MERKMQKNFNKWPGVHSMLGEAILQLGPPDTRHSLTRIYQQATAVWKTHLRPIPPNFKAEIRGTLQSFSWDDEQRRRGNPKLFISCEQGYWGYKEVELADLLL